MTWLVYVSAILAAAAIFLALRAISQASTAFDTAHEYESRRRRDRDEDRKRPVREYPQFIGVCSRCSGQVVSGPSVREMPGIPRRYLRSRCEQCGSIAHNLIPMIERRAVARTEPEGTDRT